MLARQSTVPASLRPECWESARLKLHRPMFWRDHNIYGRILRKLRMSPPRLRRIQKENNRVAKEGRSVERVREPARSRLRPALEATQLRSASLLASCRLTVDALRGKPQPCVAPHGARLETAPSRWRQMSFFVFVRDRRSLKYRSRASEQ